MYIATDCISSDAFHPLLTRCLISTENLSACLPEGAASWVTPGSDVFDGPGEAYGLQIKIY